MTAPLRILVCGGRDFANSRLMTATLLKITSEPGETRARPGTTIIHGDARGADRLSDIWALKKGVPVERFPADWEAHGRRAGPIRNAEMLARGRPDLVVAFPGGAGTADMVARARKAGVPVQEIQG